MARHTFKKKLEYNLSLNRTNEWYDYNKLAQVYIRIGERMIIRNKVARREKVITVANITVWRPNCGTFTKLIEDLLKYGYPIILENVLDKRWESVLLTKYGWEVHQNRGEFPNDLIKG